MDPPPGDTAPVVDILSLPRAVRDDIYRRVLVVRHPIFVFQETGSSVVESFAPDKPRRWHALRHVSHKVCDEAREILYGANHFSFMDTAQHQASLLSSFLHHIGPVNAGHLRHISINFPVMSGLGSVGKHGGGEFTLREDDLQSMQLLQEKCTSLKTLEMRLYGQNAADLYKASQDTASAQLVREALIQIDARREAISSLDDFIIRVYGEPLAPELEESKRWLGWAVLPGR